MSAGNLSARERTMLKFGDELIDLLRARDEVGALAIASALPAPNSAALRRNRYASAYTFVEADKAHGRHVETYVSTAAQPASVAPQRWRRPALRSACTTGTSVRRRKRWR